MKHVIGAVLLVASSSVLANPIIDAVKEKAWPIYKCSLNVEGKDVLTTTNDQEYNRYELTAENHMYVSTINDSSELVLLVNREHNKDGDITVQGVIFKGVKPISTYSGFCKL
jgi:hypothetical protein